MSGTVVDHAEQSEQLRPRSEAVVHCVGVSSGVGPETFEQASDRIIILVSSS